MKTNEIIEGNKLIAEFMGYVLHDLGDGKSPYYNHNNKYLKPCAVIRLDKGEKLQFDSSWDWLMPVVEKIESLTNYVNTVEYNKSNYLGAFYFSILTIPFSSITQHVYINAEHKKMMGKDVTDSWADTKIEAVYKVVVEFIKWYNGK
jgi:hypothetical protein